MQPDVPAVTRAFDYTVPEDLATLVRVGTIVRVPLHGRRVRGWVLADDVESEVAAAQLRPLQKVVSAGPPPDMVALCEWASWRWAGPVATFLRAASPPSIVDPASVVEIDAALYPAVAVPDGVADALDGGGAVRVVSWPPATDRRALVRGLLATEGSTLVLVPEPACAGALVRAIERDGREVLYVHGALADRERTAAWDEARRGATVVVGGRAAVFLPLPDLRAVVVLDDGDEAFQQEGAPTWHAREVAVERAGRVRRTRHAGESDADGRRACGRGHLRGSVGALVAGRVATAGSGRPTRRRARPGPAVVGLGSGRAPRGRRRWPCDLRGQPAWPGPDPRVPRVS